MRSNSKPSLINWSKFEQQQQEETDFKEKQRQESKNIDNWLFTLKPETLCLSESNGVLNETSDKISWKLILQKKHLSKISSHFGDQFEQIGMNSITKSEEV